ncbi:hypothetical protein M413DRAFT_6757 [Hebeloma cylindrosporum]|uniref:Uncharacterized protein n=1 Tax=Hebeloma cylindrosporum TaxID=76867 RepID=A0A0C2YJK3_HEBCY|nr:hypothetical protein M413DRAFT_6757 [Hebeloma cylindrosporum h7]
MDSTNNVSHSNVTHKPTCTPTDSPPRGAKSLPDACYADLLRGTRNKERYVTYTEHSGPEATDTSEEDVEMEDHLDVAPTPAFQVADWTQAVIGRYPRPKQGPLLPKQRNLLGLRRPFEKDYNDYSNGPSLDVLDPHPDAVVQLAQLSLVYILNRVITTPWTLFKDYGYRLLPDFLQVFCLQEPIQVREHLAPVGLKERPPAFTTAPETSRSGDRIERKDRLVLGAGELLELANNLGSDLPLLTGRKTESCTADNTAASFIHLDLERDRVKPDRLFKACDIDSLIWITRTPRFNGSFGLYRTPQIRDKPPIWKNNHIMVQLLYPQSEEDKHGLRSEWQAKPFRLSRIPHLSLGSAGQITRSVELILFFPRMTHQHPYTHRWQNAVPLEIQQFFWDSVLLPAWDYITSPVQRPYNTLKREHAEYKMRRGKGLNNKGKAADPHPIDTQELTKLVTLMKYIVKGSKSLSQKDGITLTTSLRGAKERFIESFHVLDLDYMKDPENGELICDVGVTIQPDHEFPVVGLWRLDCVEASYGAAGFLTGNLHTVNSLALYGGLQAESPEKHCERTGVVFRQTYNLPWEATHKIDNSRDIFNEKDVYQQNKIFDQEMKSVRQVFQSHANTMSYGVRDEFRVEDFMDSEPILWLPSEIWFEFIDRRLGILSETQAYLFATRPANYGVLSGLLAYLMQSVMFTPPVVNTFVRESLAALQFKRIADSFGMFFLQTLDLQAEQCLEDVLQVDDPSIKRILGTLKEPGVQFIRPPAPEDEPDNYPLGRNPTWAEIKRSLQDNPLELVSPWSFPVELQSYVNAAAASIEQKACKIFIAFCRGLWISLNPQWLAHGAQPVEPTTVQGALECWSLDYIVQRTTKDAEYRPCNSGRFKGGSGPRSIPFGERWKTYFVDEGVALPLHFKAMGEESGYIHLYQQTARPLNVDDIQELNRCLEELLSHCQCLPDSDLEPERNAIWKVEKAKIIILVNADHYRIEGVGTEPRGGKRVRRAPRAPVAHRAPKDVQIGLLMLEGHSAEDSAKAVRIKAKAVLAREKRKLREEEKRKAGRRSNKAKNFRRPPKARNMPEEADDEEAEEEDEESQRREGSQRKQTMRK